MLIWTQRGGQTGEEKAKPPSKGEKWAWALLSFGWRLLGLLLWPLLFLRARRFMVGLPAPEPGWIWLHGASAGEHVAARALAELLPPEVWRTSSSWRTPVAGAFPAPLDLPFVINPWLDRARPRLLILVESELWPGWLEGARRRGIPVAVVNARNSRGTARLRRHPWIWRWLTRDITFISQEVTGDLKLSARMRDATFALGRDALVGASTRPGDEARLIGAWRLLREPRPLLVLAPRHLERRAEVLALLKSSGLPWVSRQDQQRAEAKGQAAPIPADTAILLLDTMGELGSLMRQGRAAFIGGTFDVSIGGHSPAEAFIAGLPVVHGPHTSGNPAAWNQGIALRVADGAELERRLASALQSAMALGPRAAPQNDAAVRAAGLLPEGHTPPETPARPWLSPLSPIWSALVAGAPSTWASPEKVGVPVISVGALAAGGAGKTPAVGWLAAQMPGAWVLGRGYRRRGGDDVRVGLPDQPDSADNLGDELEMLRRRGIPVVSSPDRVAGAREAERRGAKLILLDDGFQHRRLHRDADLVCIDARWPDGRGLIPVGSRREPWSALERATALWISHGDLDAAFLKSHPEAAALPRFSAAARPAGWLHRGQRLPLDARSGPVDVVVGLARPEGFVCALLKLGLQIRSLRLLPDHAPLRDVPAGAVLTEKDAARLPADADVWALTLDWQLSDASGLLAALGLTTPRPA